MPSKNVKKEHADKIRDQLIEELGQEEFKRLFEETRKNWIRETGAWPSPSQEDLIFALDYSLSEQKRRKALEQQLTSRFNFEGTMVDVSHDGDSWKVYYFPIPQFEGDLPKFGRFLETIKEKGEEATIIVPNVGWVMTSLIMGSGFQGIKGFAIIIKKHAEHRYDAE